MLLRDIHCSLLRLIQNQGVEKDKKEAKAQPVTAKLFSPDSGGSVPWTAQLAQLILVAPPTKAAAAAKVCSHTLILVKLTCCPTFEFMCPKSGEVQTHTLRLVTSCFSKSLA